MKVGNLDLKDIDIRKLNNVGENFLTRRCKTVDFIFVVKTPADEEVEMDFHRSLAKGLINKHGIDVMKNVIGIIKEKD